MDQSEAKRICSEAVAMISRGCSPQEAAVAAEMFTLVAEAGFPEGMFGLAELKYMGVGTDRDVPGAAELYRRAGGLGNIPAWFRLGNILVEDESLRDPAEALRCFNRCADAKFPPAYGCLGDMYYYGIGMEPRPEEAINWYRLASAAGDPQSMYKVGCMCRSGTGTPKDDNAADAMFRMSAEAGIPEAQFEVASLMYDGKMEGGRPEAAKWYAKCAEAIPTAKFNLATMYLEGDGVEKDPSRALGMYRELGDAHNDSDALYQTGRMLLEGIGTESDPQLGFEYLSKAAKAGNESAEAIIGVLRRKMNTQLITIDGTEEQVARRHDPQ